MMSAQGPEVLAVLRERFGIAGWRSRQAEAVDAVLAGRDVLLTMPTGAGKSLVYQLPAVVLDGITLVVSPLIALMKDQVDGLQARGIAATCVNSSVPGAERAQRLEAAARGEVDLLFVTPERFRIPAFQEMLPRLRITRLAVDEAHCISTWGHDFRPDYLHVGQYRRALGDVPCIALTATATPDVAEDIVRHLRLSDPLVVRTGIERPNLFLAASPVADHAEKLDRIASRIAAVDGAGIVYAALIKDLEAMHEALRRRGIPSLVYHGKLSARERRAMQDRFMASERDVVLATNAFGMGVDKADIRFVIHAQVPRTLEAWAQEVGRSGRDGLPAFCELLYLEEDLAIQQQFVKWANPSLQYLAGVYETLAAWGERIQTKDLDDLRAELLWKERRDNRVGISLGWLDVLGVTAGSFETHDLRVVRPLDVQELPDEIRTGEKEGRDLEALLRMVRFARDEETCRRALLARHFGLTEPTEPCGACDVCAVADAWLADHATPRPQTPDEGALPRAGAAPFHRGDWVRIDGRHLGRVLRVEGDDARLRLLVEDAADLRHRTVDPHRRRVERLDG